MRVLGNSPAEVPADNQERPPDLSEVTSETTSLSAIPSETSGSFPSEEQEGENTNLKIAKFLSLLQASSF